MLRWSVEEGREEEEEEEEEEEVKGRGIGKRLTIDLSLRLHRPPAAAFFSLRLRKEHERGPTGVRAHVVMASDTVLSSSVWEVPARTTAVNHATHTDACERNVQKRLPGETLDPLLQK
ncbi:hypothetical protein JZ751_008901 [Albula glossodonta]|uniref:Uncharacterized protein n=1 Tax=Albula glossodonta TaxID=121402 RepID=A0A8T2PAN6_9TELE|nr:hypothetical protein JZ751_008901 [Albula glossodonta]